MKRIAVVIMLMCVLVAGFGSLGPARAQGTPTAGPVQEFTVEDGRFVSLSPDGTKYAVARSNTALCVFDAQSLEQIACATLDEPRIRLRLEDVRWSPDSTKLAFAEDAFRMGADGDLWVMDAATGALTNLTDDGYSGSMFMMGDDDKDVTFFVDVAPAWTPDSRFITFSRSGFVDGERTGNDLAQVPANGGEVETLATVSPDEPGIVFFGTGWDPSGTTFYYSLTHTDLDDPENGIWSYDPATGETAMLAGSDDPELGPLTLLQVSPSGDRLLGWYPQAFGQFQIQQPLLRLIDTATGAQTSIQAPTADATLPAFPAFATFSPDGKALLVLLNQGDGVSSAWVQDLRTVNGPRYWTDWSGRT